VLTEPIAIVGDVRHCALHPRQGPIMEREASLVRLGSPSAYPSRLGCVRVLRLPPLLRSAGSQAYS
jgi:hypothetical protein